MFFPVSFSVFSRMLLAFFLLSAFPAHAEPVLGDNYAVVANPQPSENPRRVEVIEVFSYACPHCFDLEPVLAKWERKLPKDVAFIRMPAVSNPKWLALGKFYYALEALGKVGELHADALNAYHLHDVDLADEKIALNWVAKQGIDSGKFKAAFDSFSVQAKTGRARQLLAAYGISGVPAVVVGGKYMTSTAMAGGQEAMLAVVDYLVRKVRKESGGKKS